MSAEARVENQFDPAVSINRRTKRKIVEKLI